MTNIPSMPPSNKTGITTVFPLHSAPKNNKSTNTIAGDDGCTQEEMDKLQRDIDDLNRQIDAIDRDFDGVLDLKEKPSFRPGLWAEIKRRYTELIKGFPRVPTTLLSSHEETLTGRKQWLTDRRNLLQAELNACREKARKLKPQPETAPVGDKVTEPKAQRISTLIYVPTPHQINLAETDKAILAWLAARLGVRIASSAGGDTVAQPQPVTGALLPTDVEDLDQRGVAVADNANRESADLAWSVGSFNKTARPLPNNIPNCRIRDKNGNETVVSLTAVGARASGTLYASDAPEEKISAKLYRGNDNKIYGVITSNVSKKSGLTYNGFNELDETPDIFSSPSLLKDGAPGMLCLDRELKSGVMLEPKVE